MIKIILADDHQVIRRGIKSFLKTDTNFNIIGETGDGKEAVELVIKLQPDILVLDMIMPGLNGLQVTKELNQKCPRTGIVILSMHNNEAYVVEALRCGAKAYILKDSFAEDLIQGIKEVFSGGHYLSPSLSQKAIRIYSPKTPSQDDFTL